MPNSRCMVSVPAARHSHKDEGYFVKTFLKTNNRKYVRIQFISYSIMCQAAKFNCRLISTLSSSTCFLSDFQSRSRSGTDRCPEHFVFARAWGGSLNKQKTISLPNGSADGFSCLWEQRHCLHRCLCIYTSIACTVTKFIQSANYRTIKVQPPGAMSTLPVASTPLRSGSSSFSLRSSSFPFREMVRLRMPLVPVRA